MEKKKWKKFYNGLVVKTEHDSESDHKKQTETKTRKENKTRKERGNENNNNKNTKLASEIFSVK